MPRACNLLRRATHYRRECFDAGLRACGYTSVDFLRDPRPDDLLVTWNSYGHAGDEIRRFKAAGARVLVAENGLLGKTWRGGEWFSLALDEVACTGGRYRPGHASRWDSWDVQLQPWRPPGGDTVILGQRGIGSPQVRSPDGWADATQQRYGGRLRRHPGTAAVLPLEQDLRGASAVITWSSAAALQALVLGVPVFHVHADFIGAPACTRLFNAQRDGAKRDSAARLDMFRSMAWAMWTLDEIKTGAPIGHLLGL